ncbi:MAG: glycosyltransferase [Rubricoccaceae bacterium]
MDGLGRPLRVLLVHNYYQLPGGEDQVFEAEEAILKANGHDVGRLTVSNDTVADLSRLGLAKTTVWSRAGHDAVEAAARDHRADVVHFHNTLPLISPAGYYGARSAGAAVIQTLHNFRLICPGALLYRDGAPCEICVGKTFAAPGVRHGCYRGSRSATMAVASMTAAHRVAGTWQRAVDRYIAITVFARDKFIAGGLPVDRIAVKANPMSVDPGMGEGNGDFALFVGRLDAGKGVSTVLKAWQDCAALPPLVIVGDGPEAPLVQEAVDRMGADRIRWKGWLQSPDVLALMRRARAFVFASHLYEGGTPMTLVEAFASGLPVAATDRGAAQALVRDGIEGVRFTPQDPQALAAAVHEILRDPTAYQAMRNAARAAFEQTYAPEPNYAVLARIYSEALATRYRDDRSTWA